MSPLTLPVPCAENEGDALLVVSPLRLYHRTRQRYTLKTSRELVYVHFRRFSLELHTWMLNCAIKCVVCIFSSKMYCLSEHVVCASVFSTLLWKSLGSQKFVEHHCSITKNVLKKSNRVVEAALLNLSL
jgi:hypothetical protein